MPCRLCIDLDCLMILRTSLGAAAPEEGCALLLGEATPEISVRVVWPCCNVWLPGFPGFGHALEERDDQDSINPSRRSRFALDPMEQIAAQRWSRRKGLQVLGSAHSHPGGQPVPSELDRRWAISEGVMIIDAGAAGLRAWWLHGASGQQPSPLSMVDSSGPLAADAVSSCADRPFLPVQSRKTVLMPPSRHGSD